MPGFDQFWTFLLAALLAGLAVGAIIARSLSNSHAHFKEVRWKRRFSEMQSDHELAVSKLGKSLDLAEQKQSSLRQALDEADETVRLLSADRPPTLEHDIAERNIQIAELRKRLSHARATIADAKDQENTLHGQIATLQSELVGREKCIEEMRQELPARTGTLREHEASIDDLVAELEQQRQRTLLLEKKIANLNAGENESGGTHHGGARVISIHSHALTDDLVGPVTATRPDSDTEYRIRVLENELQQWKCKYEAANANEDSILSEIPVTQNDQNRERDTRVRDDLQQIRGIGPAIESALNELGVYQFEQLARIGEGEIEQMACRDSSLPGRIRRYRWIEQARRLHQEHSPDSSQPHA